MLSCNLREELVAISERQDICSELGERCFPQSIKRNNWYWYSNQYPCYLHNQKATSISFTQMILDDVPILKVLVIIQLIPFSISGLEPMLTCEKIARERYENLLKKQKLTNISKQQAEQISILQAEVERLRMKTFPALIPM